MAHGATDTTRRRTAVGYLRRSTDRQEQSIPDQRKAVEQYAKEQGLQLHKHYVDDAISGTSTLGRKAFQQMMADAQQHPERAAVLRSCSPRCPLWAMLRNRLSHTLCSANTLLEHDIPSVQAAIRDGHLARGHSLFIEPKQESIEMADIELHGE